MTLTATAIAHPNIAFIKYWGNRDDMIRLPTNGSISMNLEALYTRTTVTFSRDFRRDVIRINGKKADPNTEFRIEDWLDDLLCYVYHKNLVDKKLAMEGPGKVEIISENSFPTGAGIASSASAFAALTLATFGALGIEPDEADLSYWARRGSGSACRSIPEGFCEWDRGSGTHDSYAYSLAPASHWDLVDLITVISTKHKKVGSSKGHRSADTSPFQAERVRTAPERIAKCRNAILEKDFTALAEVSEQDMIMMHSVMMTQDPPLFYWEPLTIRVIKAVRDWRESGLDCFATVDAGPNVHVICTSEAADEVRSRLEKIKGIRGILSSGPGGKAKLL